MSAQEISKLRVTILKGLNDSSKNLLNMKIQNNRSVAISRDDQVLVIPARNLYR
jgi:hypothetical protein